MKAEWTNKLKCQEVTAATTYYTEESIMYKVWKHVSDSLIISSLV